MDTLDNTHWDVVIVGTGLVQSLIALSLSRSDKKVLHIDRNSYYGGPEAAFSLDEAQGWADEYAGDDHVIFRNAVITIPDAAHLSPSRAYSVALAPQLLHARSNLIPALVSSRLHNQLEFQAVGSFFTLESSSEPSSESSQEHGHTRRQVIRVPSGREDIFASQSLDIRTKRSLMKFLRFVANQENEEWDDDAHNSFPAVVQRRFGLPQGSLGPLLALTLSGQAADSITFGEALPAIERHLRSIGTFGPGFSAVIPKWGGLAELAQVACRACAVGGGVYVLNKDYELAEPFDGDKLHLKLDQGENVTSSWLVGLRTDLLHDDPTTNVFVMRRIVIVSSPLSSMFPPTSEGGVTPAGAVLFVVPSSQSMPPVQVMIHSSEAGECPSTQSVLYASTLVTGDDTSSRLDDAISSILSSVEESADAKVLWQLQYLQRGENSKSDKVTVSESHIVGVPGLSTSLAIEDDVLERVEQAWKAITGDDSATFLNFEARDAFGDVEESTN